MSTEDSPAPPVDDMLVREDPPTPQILRERLRRDFPDWGFIHEPRSGMWTAMRGKQVFIQRSDALQLRLAIQAVVEQAARAGDR